MTLQEYLDRLGWTPTDLAREARINYRTALKAINGEEVSRRVAQDIAQALSASIGQRILVGDISGLNYR